MPFPAAVGPPTPEELAESFVAFGDATAPEDGRFVRLAAPGCEPVTFGPFPTPQAAEDWRDGVRRFVAAAIRSAVRQR